MVTLLSDHTPSWPGQPCFPRAPRKSCKTSTGPQGSSQNRTADTMNKCSGLCSCSLTSGIFFHLYAYILRRENSSSVFKKYRLGAPIHLSNQAYECRFIYLVVHGFHGYVPLQLCAFSQRVGFSNLNNT